MSRSLGLLGVGVVWYVSCAGFVGQGPAGSRGTQNTSVPLLKIGIKYPPVQKDPGSISGIKIPHTSWSQRK